MTMSIARLEDEGCEVILKRGNRRFVTVMMPSAAILGLQFWRRFEIPTAGAQTTVVVCWSSTISELLGAVGTST